MVISKCNRRSIFSRLRRWSIGPHRTGESPKSRRLNKASRRPRRKWFSYMRGSICLRILLGKWLVQQPMIGSLPRNSVSRRPPKTRPRHKEKSDAAATPSGYQQVQWISNHYLHTQLLYQLTSSKHFTIYTYHYTLSFICFPYLSFQYFWPSHLFRNLGDFRRQSWARYLPHRYGLVPLAAYWVSVVYECAMARAQCCYTQSWSKGRSQRLLAKFHNTWRQA